MLRRSIYLRPEYERIMFHGVKEPGKRALNALWGAKRRHNPLRRLIAVWRIMMDTLRVWRSLDALPEPTEENVGHPNSVILVRISNYFFACERLPYLHKPLRKLVTLVIIIYDTHFYRPFLDVWVRELRAAPWRAPGPRQPDPHYWDESAAEPPYGELLRLEDRGDYYEAVRWSESDRADARALLRV